MQVPSAERQDKIEKEILNDNDFWNKELGQSLLNDFNVDDEK
ncbi:hypothetical protein [Elizabethkingia anophelis]|nr:hypothetical protein [Elizabethkingia anophelis]